MQGRASPACVPFVATHCWQPAAPHSCLPHLQPRHSSMPLPSLRTRISTRLHQPAGGRQVSQSKVRLSLPRHLQLSHLCIGGLSQCRHLCGEQWKGREHCEGLCGTCSSATCATPASPAPPSMQERSLGEASGGTEGQTAGMSSPSVSTNTSAAVHKRAESQRTKVLRKVAASGRFHGRGGHIQHPRGRVGPARGVMVGAGLSMVKSTELPPQRSWQRGLPPSDSRGQEGEHAG